MNTTDMELLDITAIMREYEEHRNVGRTQIQLFSVKEGTENNCVAVLVSVLIKTIGASL